MADSVYTYTKTPVALDSLTQQIQQAGLATALDYVAGLTLLGSALSIPFISALSGGDKTTLDAVVAAHDGTPLPSNTTQNVAVLTQPSVVVSAQPAPLPFAQPTYRTKDNATSTWITCPSNTATNIDFQITSEIWTHGGELIVYGAQEGDYISACVNDVDSVIPSPYRAAMCEAWPIVSTYIIKRWMIPNTSGYTAIEKDTYPLIADIPAGLYMRMTYNATSSAGDRRAAVNYFMTKKL